MNEEVMQVFEDTDHEQCSGLCNITFRTFLLANYTDECLQKMFPKLALHYNISGEGEE